MQKPSEQNYIPQLSIDCVIFGYTGGQLHVLVPKLNFNGNFWALPSGFVFQDESLYDAAARILTERTSLQNIALEQFHAFGAPDRHSIAFMEKLMELNADRLGKKEANQHEYEWFTRRFVSIGYYALVDVRQVVPQTGWIDERIEWVPVNALPDMIMDHREIVGKALETLRLHLDQKLIAFRLLPETFTMKDVQDVYESILNRPLARNNFQKKILDMDVLDRLEKKFTGAANKAPYLYRLRKENQQFLL